MQNAIKAAADEGDSVGGVLESAVTGVPAGVGEPFFDTVEGLLSHALFSIPGVKGVSFGGGFSLADAKGSEYNDPFAVKDGKIVTTTNNNGGVNGGITNGMPLLFSVAVKPTPSVYKEQQTVNFEKLENVSLKISGRHDPAIIHRARAVADAMTAIVIADLLTGRFGTDYLGGDR
jgi:chorismate synthase